MTEAPWQQLQSLFDQALERPPERRAAFVAQACAGDLGLRRELEALLRAHDAASGFLEAPAGGGLPGQVAELVGSKVGPYTIVSEIGRGGMGAVYRARRDDEYVKEVALKLLTGGRSALLVERFRQERRILARLEHPSIARLIDGGTTAGGDLYFAMEYVEGEPLDAYCGRAGLGLRSRLELFRAVCGAVSYAHRNLVVHRDLKPSNILVTADGTPKLLDFGIAKLLAPDDPTAPELTRTGMALMTPEYASPEQVSGGPVTTATDIYALGVLLYQLLANRRPYELPTRDPAEIARIVCQQQPRAPSAAADVDVGAETVRLRRALAGDLDTIVLKALRKEPERRYRSVDELSEDLGRYLDGRPVLARRDTFRYRTGKFVKRHRGAVAAAVLVALSLVSGLAATLREARIAEWNRARAERRFAETRKLAHALLFDIHDNVAKLPGSLRVRERIVTSAVDYLDGLSRDAAGDTQLQLELAAAWQKLGTIQGGLYEQNLGRRADSERSFTRAGELARAAVAASPKDPGAWRRLGDQQLSLGLLRMTQGDVRGALAEFEAAVGSCGAGLKLAPADAELRRLRPLAHGRRAFALALNDRIPEALEESRRSVSELEALLAERPSDADLRRKLDIELQRLGQFEEALAPRQRAGLPAYRRSLELAEALAAEKPGDVGVLSEVLASLSAMAESLDAAGDYGPALEASARALAGLERLAAMDADDVRARSDLAYQLSRHGAVLTRAGRPHEALPLLARARRLLDPLLAADPGHAQLRVRGAQLALAEGRAWASLAAQGPAAERRDARQHALARLREANALWTRLDADGLVFADDRPSLVAVAAELRALEASNRP